MRPTHTIRLATPADAPYVRDTVITFEQTVPTVAAFAARIEQIAAVYPYLVYERDGAIGGYAYAHALRERQAFGWAAELSIYLAPTAQGRGVGTVLYRCLLALLEKQGLRRLYGCVTLPNARSERLHDRLGFARVGVWQDVGWKKGGWHDVGWYEKHIGGTQAARPVCPLPQMEHRAVQECLRRYSEMLDMEE